MQRALLWAVALVISVSGASLVALTSPAGAATSKITCTTIAGTVQTTIEIGGCTGGNTGGGSQPIPGAAFGVGWTIPWVSGSTTTVSLSMPMGISAKKCAGYVKGSPSNPAAIKFAGTVIADSGDNLRVPGNLTATYCLFPSGQLTVLKPLKAN